MKMEFVFDEEGLKRERIIDDAFDETTACGPDHLNPDKVSLEEFAASIQRGHDDIAADRYYTLDEAFERLKEKYSV